MILIKIIKILRLIIFKILWIKSNKDQFQQREILINKLLTIKSRNKNLKIH
jgi:hypothetical protein